MILFLGIILIMTKQKFFFRVFMTVMVILVVASLIEAYWLFFDNEKYVEMNISVYKAICPIQVKLTGFFSYCRVLGEIINNRP